MAFWETLPYRGQCPSRSTASNKWTSHPGQAHRRRNEEAQSWDNATNLKVGHTYANPTMDSNTKNTMNCKVGFVSCFWWVPLACLGSRAGTPVELWENSFQTSLYSSFCLSTQQSMLNLACHLGGRQSPSRYSLRPSWPRIHRQSLNRINWQLSTKS